MTGVRGVVVTIPIRTATGLNSREHWATRARRVKRERKATSLMLRGHFRGMKTPPADIPWFPFVVTLIRMKPRGKLLDGDNLQGALKAIRDEVALLLKVDDGSDKVQWHYGQAKGPWGVQVTVENAITARLREAEAFMTRQLEKALFQVGTVPLESAQK